MPTIDEIAPDTFRISVFMPQIGLQFNHFLIRDDEPLLFHTGLRGMFPEVFSAVKTLIDPAKLRWVSWSHFESDECGALNDWLAVAPHAQAACSSLGAQVSVNDFAIRAPRGLQDGEILSTGKHQFRFCSTAHLPHGWDAGVLFDETTRTLLCSDLFTHFGAREALTTKDIVSRARESLENMQRSPFAYYIPYTPQTPPILERLAKLQPATLATMHGSSYSGDGSQALRDLTTVLREVLS